ncbi:DNA cytosine methyltransferase, partial [Bifidobacterium breve]|nr:DNA cytosine methyltransferase [Bifidobacterium breve]
VGGSGSGWGNKHEWDRPHRDRVYTTTELERLQTLPDGYTRGIPERQRRKSLGNGWTAEVIIELMQHMNIDKD